MHSIGSQLMFCTCTGPTVKSLGLCSVRVQALLYNYLAGASCMHSMGSQLMFLTCTGPTVKSLALSNIQ